MQKFSSIMIRVAALIASIAAVAASASAAGNERILYVFTGGADGGHPSSDLIFDAQGNLYGTTEDGGDFGDGTVFELTPGPPGAWTETVLHSFHNDGKDGANPCAGLTFDKAGNIWGTTEHGGDDNNGGTVFEFSRAQNGMWSEIVLSLQHGHPYSGLIFDKAGDIYGTTSSDSRNLGSGMGAVFRFAPAANRGWTRTTLYAFRLENPYSGSPISDGAAPNAGVVLDPAGNLYGTTLLGSGVGLNEGTVFKLTLGPNGVWTETLLHSFNDAVGDGAKPLGALIVDGLGNLYGTTATGGPFRGGTVFKLTHGTGNKWSEVILHAFNSSDGNGNLLDGRLVLDKSGNLFGTTEAGGDTFSGAVFELSSGPSGIWSETVLHGFARNRTEGAFPKAGLTFDAQGNLYGTTSAGGGNPNDPGYGVVFEILTEAGAAVSPAVQTPALSPASAAQSSSVAPQGADSLADDWQSDAYSGQTFHFKFDGSAIYVYGSQQELLGTLQQKGKNGVIDTYEGLVQIPPLTQCPAGRGLMQIKTWNDNQLDAKIETPISTSSGVACGGLLGTGRMVRWQQVMFVRK